AFTRLARVTHRHRMRLNCDPPLPLQVHRIKKLVLSLALLNRPRTLQQPVRQGRLAVIDMRDDAKIARHLNGHGSATIESGCARSIAMPTQFVPLPTFGYSQRHAKAHDFRCYTRARGRG